MLRDVFRPIHNVFRLGRFRDFYVDFMSDEPDIVTVELTYHFSQLLHRIRSLGY